MEGEVVGASGGDPAGVQVGVSVGEPVDATAGALMHEYWSWHGES